MERLDIRQIESLIRIAIAEDLGGGDLTSEMFFKEDSICSAEVVSREDIIVAGMDVAEYVFKCYDPKLELQVHIGDGKSAKAGDKLATVAGPAGPMLSGERVVLNFLQRLSGIATATQKYVEAVSGTSAKIYDTRKTTPGWRILEKYAVRCGGGFNHRMGLFDGILIKDNHLAQLGEDFGGKLAEIIERAEKSGCAKFAAVEVDSIEEQLPVVLEISGVDIILLDNMEIEELKKAVEMRDSAGKEGKVLLEASGGVTLDNVAEVAGTGIDRIAVGAITHSARAVDIGLDRE